MELKDIYSLVGIRIVESINEKWIKATLNIEAYLNDYVKFEGSYINNSGIEKYLNIDVKELREMKRAIYELIQIMTNGGHNRWNKAIFRIWPDNNFDMEFIWDQKLDDEIKNNS